VVRRGRQHDGHALARHDTGALQPGGDGRRRVGELAVADVLPAAFLYVVGQHDELRLLGMPLHVPRQHVEQGAGVHRRAGLPGGRVGRRGVDEGSGQRVHRSAGR